MKKLITILFTLLLLLTGCASEASLDLGSSAVTSEVPDESSSDTSAVSSQTSKSSFYGVSSTTSMSIPPFYLGRPVLERKIESEEFHVIIDSLGQYQCRGLGDADELTLRINSLIANNNAMYRFYFLEAFVDYDGYDKICDDVLPARNTAQWEINYEWLSGDLFSTYTTEEAEKILSDPTYRGKRYHYFEQDGILYIDQTVAKQQDFIPYSFTSAYTYRYDIHYYKFNYTQTDDSHIDIEVFLYDRLEQKFVKLPLTAVLENGDWKLTKIVFEEDIVDIDSE